MASERRRWLAAAAAVEARLAPLRAADAAASQLLADAREAAELSRCACDEVLGEVAVEDVERKATMAAASSAETRLRSALHAATARSDAALRTQAGLRSSLARASSAAALAGPLRAAEAAERLLSTRGKEAAALESQLLAARAATEERRAACAQLLSRLHPA